MKKKRALALTNRCSLMGWYQVQTLPGCANSSNNNNSIA